MKLATRYQRTNLVATLVLFLLASVAFYVLLNRVLIFQVDEDLEIEQHEIEAHTARYGTLPQNVTPVEDQIVRFEKTTGAMQKPVRQTVALMDEVEKEESDFRQLIFTVQVRGEWYKVSVSKSLEGTEGLARMIGLIALATIALMLIISFLINRLVLRQLWKPFYKTVERMQAFELGKNDSLILPIVPIEEFALLNKTLQAATGKASQDYQVLKEFTENASHELQTPLAIVRSKLDLLIQDEHLSEQQSGLIQSAYDAIRRMTHLNQSLLMLAKIEGGQYAGRSTVDMKALLEERLANFDSFIEDKKLKLDSSIQPTEMQINPALADMLLNNLLSNAIYHNRVGGTIIVRLTAHDLTVCNTSENGALDQASLFDRFSKTTAVTTRTGLGLAITKQVCNASDCSVKYHFEERGMHCFTVGWMSGGKTDSGK